jgi:hypothetical protein
MGNDKYSKMKENSKTTGLSCQENPATENPAMGGEVNARHLIRFQIKDEIKAARRR